MHWLFYQISVLFRSLTDNLVYYHHLERRINLRIQQEECTRNKSSNISNMCISEVFEKTRGSHFNVKYLHRHSQFCLPLSQVRKWSDQDCCCASKYCHPSRSFILIFPTKHIGPRWNFFCFCTFPPFIGEIVFVVFLKERKLSPIPETQTVSRIKNWFERYQLSYLHTKKMSFFYMYIYIPWIFYLSCRYT